MYPLPHPSDLSTDTALLENAFARNTALCLDGRIIRPSTFPVQAGGYADVFEGHFENRRVAIKVLRPFGLQRGKLFRRLWREYLTWSRLSHPNILACLGYSYDFSPESYTLPSLVSPWMENGSVTSYLERYPNADRIGLIIGIARGLSYLHSCEPVIVHGDLRAGNILVSDHGIPCLTDFGLSRVLEEIKGMTTSSDLAGCVRWMSPELFSSDCEVGVNVKSDIWAYGMTVLEVMSGERPYSTFKNDIVVLGQIRDGKLPSRPQNFEVREVLDDYVWTTCQKCWSREPSSRPSMQEVTSMLISCMNHERTGHISVPDDIPSRSYHIASDLSESYEPLLLPLPEAEATMNNLDFELNSDDRDDMGLFRSPSPSLWLSAPNTDPQNQGPGGQVSLPSPSQVRFTPYPRLSSLQGNKTPGLYLYDNPFLTRQLPTAQDGDALTQSCASSMSPLHIPSGPDAASLPGDISSLSVKPSVSIHDFPSTPSDPHTTDAFDVGVSMRRAKSDSHTVSHFRRGVKSEDLRAPPPSHLRSDFFLYPGVDSVGGALNTTNPPQKLVTMKATHDASRARRKNDPGFVCPVPGCGSTFTRSFNLKGHLRSHNEAQPFKCKWPGCERGFARQHDCKRHEALHLNIRPYTCGGCKKTFARMGALNRHRLSEEGANCTAAADNNPINNNPNTPPSSPSDLNSMIM